jgi:hypothetical protein
MEGSLEPPQHRKVEENGISKYVSIYLGIPPSLFALRFQLRFVFIIHLSHMCFMSCQFQSLWRDHYVIRDMKCERNVTIEARSRNNFCCGKALSITYSQGFCSLSYSACDTHAPCYIVTCGVSGSTIFFHIISQTTWLSGKTYCFVFCFLYNFYLNTSLSRIIQRDIIMKIHRSPRKVPVILVRV